MYEVLVSLSPLLLLILFMYIFFIKPQRKREKDTEAMRQNAKVGDEIITIGGICGKIVRTKEESIVIQVGAEKVKFEVMRWGISSIVNRDALADLKKEAEEGEGKDASAKKSARPKKMKRLDKAEEKANPAAEVAQNEPKEPQA